MKKNFKFDFKKNFLLLTLFLIIIIQTLLYANNNQRTSFRSFNWTFKEVSVGKLISISFFSGLIISSLLNISFASQKKNTYETKEEKNEALNNEKDVKSNIEMPPQRDIRDSQPTISVNYRVVKNTDENNLDRDQNYSSRFDNKDDWSNDDNDW